MSIEPYRSYGLAHLVEMSMYDRNGTLLASFDCGCTSTAAYMNNDQVFDHYNVVQPKRFKCRYCDTEYLDFIPNCHNCGAPMRGIDLSE